MSFCTLDHDYCSDGLENTCTPEPTSFSKLSVYEMELLKEAILDLSRPIFADLKLRILVLAQSTILMTDDWNNILMEEHGEPAQSLQDLYIRVSTLQLKLTIDSSNRIFGASR